MVNILSLGAGVQSSTMALMASKGELGYDVDCAIFADTQSEPASVYEWLEWLKTQLTFPLHIVTQGSLHDESLKIFTSKTNSKYMKSAIPAYLDGEMGKGIMMRQCTYDFKIKPINKKIKSLYKKQNVNSLLGISTNEAGRMKLSREKYITNVYPLIELGMSRNDCLQWMEKNQYPKPPRSSCYFCPFHSNREWHDLKTQQPTEFAKAIKYEKEYQMQTRNILDGVPFLHPSRKPLDTISFIDENQVELFTNECEGMCGV